MLEDRKIQLRGKDYEISNPIGPFVFAALNSLNNKVTDLKSQQNVAEVLLQCIPDLPRSIVMSEYKSGERVYNLGLFTEEWLKVVALLRIVYFQDSLETCVEHNFKVKEIDLIKGLANAVVTWNRTKEFLEPDTLDIDKYIKASEKDSEGTNEYWGILKEYWTKQQSKTNEEDRIHFCQSQLDKIPKAIAGKESFESNQDRIKELEAQLKAVQAKKALTELKEETATAVVEQ